MIRKLFIANRGEIALRVIRTAQRMGIETVLGASEADSASLPARLADHVEIVGPGPSSQGYLSIDRVVSAAVRSGCDAVHPGYGFLSENARFARAVLAAGMRFVGPEIATLEGMGDKLAARALAVEAGLPVLPGGEAATRADVHARAAQTGYPLLLKAVAGGGGKGMRRVDRPDDLDTALDMAQAEAQAAFGNAAVYVERFVAMGRHVEVQLLGDGTTAIHLGTRDCSIQRRFQKLVEEAPAPAMPIEAREGRTVRELGDAIGVDAMHALEASHLHAALAAPRPRVITAAAFTIEVPACRTALLDPDVVPVWLTASPRTLAARFAAGGHRPAYGDDPETFLAAQLARRAPWYQAVGALEIDVEGQPPERVADRILDALDLVR